MLALVLSALLALSPQQQELRDIYEQLVEIDTSHTTGATTPAAEAVARRLRDAGIPAQDIQVLGPVEGKKNLVARIRGKGSRGPLLLLAHLDVVDARREDWSIDPFTLNEADGYFYGRGTIDDKAMAAMFTVIFINLSHMKERPERDVILALTADEESGPDNGVEWLLDTHRDLVDASLVINEGGGGRMRDGAYIFNGIQASEKSYMTFVIESLNKGGHSSVPAKDNAIYRVANALTRIEAHEFPVELNDVTRDFFQRSAKLETGQAAEDMLLILRDPPDPDAVKRLSERPVHNALLRTTCVATRLDGGHADNALPQMARATINCRILPGHPTQEVQDQLAQVIADDQVTIRAVEKDTAAPGSPLDPGIVQTVERITAQMWPGVPVIATMSTGATDSRYFRMKQIPAYGISGIFGDMNDIRAHGRDERVGVKQFWEGYEFLTRLVDALCY